MKSVSIALALALFAACLLAAPAQEKGWQEVDAVLGSTGKDLADGVHKFSWPRSDLRVQKSGVSIEPALALGSWAAFRRSHGEETVAMGDLVLLESEVAPVVDSLEKQGFEILAIHNHLLGEEPRVLYVHFHGMGEPAAVARTLRGALEKTKTPLTSSTKAPEPLTPDEQATFQKVQDLLGRKGSMAGRVLQVAAPRAETIREDSFEVPAAMGMATAINFEITGAGVATTGDFVLVASEVNPVIRELQARGIEPTALHSHMLRETPRLFFLHFWGVGAPEKIVPGLKAALAKMAVAP